MTSNDSDKINTTTLAHWQQCLEERKPKVIEAQCLITTPMFIGNGSQDAVDVRPPSIKGALRFWWRAMQWHRFLVEENNDIKQALRAMHSAEAELFGSTAKDSPEAISGGQSRFNLDVLFEKSAKGNGNWQPDIGIQYLLGQGCYKPGRSGQVTRQYLDNGQTFTIKLNAKAGSNAPSAQQWQELELALLLWGLIGGLGSRGRKGLGAISIHQLTGGQYNAPVNTEQYKSLLLQLLKPASSLFIEPPFTALSGLCRLDISEQGDDPVMLLNKIGEELQHYRAWGHDGKVGNNRDALKNFKQDHDDGLQASQGKTPSQPARRAIFGLPHNYRFKSTGANLGICIKPKMHKQINANTNGDRRASPLFIHIHQLPDGQSLAVQLLLPAQFLPSENQQLSYNKKMNVPMPNNTVDWHVITRYLDEHFANAETLVKDGRHSK